MTLIVSDQDGGTKGWKRDMTGVGVGVSVMEGKESKSESRKMAGGDAVGQSVPFVCVFAWLR